MNPLHKPSFLVSKGEREGDEGIYFDESDEYRDIAKSIYLWDGLPNDVPIGYIEEMLFEFGSISAKNVPAIGIVISPAAFTHLDIYGYPDKWVPCGQTYTSSDKVTAINKESNNPVLYLGRPMKHKIEFDAKTLKHAKISLLQNILGMRQPIAFESVSGNSQDSVLTNKEINDGNPSIAVIDSSKVKAEVIDLGVKDFTQPLLNVEQDQDAKILKRMGVDNRGVEKASGINIEETTAHDQQLSLTLTMGLLKRQAWCDAINPHMTDDLGNKYKFSVKINPAYDQSVDAPEDTVNGGESNGED